MHDSGMHSHPQCFSQIMLLTWKWFLTWNFLSCLLRGHFAIQSEHGTEKRKFDSYNFQLPVPSHRIVDTILLHTNQSISLPSCTAKSKPWLTHGKNSILGTIQENRRLQVCQLSLLGNYFMYSTYTSYKYVSFLFSSHSRWKIAGHYLHDHYCHDSHCD